MDAQYQIEVEPQHDLVHIRLSGFFTPEAMAGFVAAREQAFARLRCPVSRHLALTDVRAMKIQSQEMVDAWGRLLADRSRQARRLAFVVGSTLARQQLQRALAGRDACCFTDLAQARAWLFADRAGSPAYAGAAVAAR